MALPFASLRINRTGQGYVIQDHIYVKSRDRNGTTYLRCQRYKTCRAAAKIVDLMAYVTNPVHNHEAPDIEAKQFRASVVTKAQDTANARLSVKNIYDAHKEIATSSATSNAEQEEADVLLPTLGNVASAMYRARKGHMPPNPTSRENIDPQEIMRIYQDNDGNSFLLDWSPGNHIMVFGGSDRLWRLGEAEILHMDATFWVTPVHFYQFLTIHSRVYGQMIPFFYVLLSGKSAALYREMFQIIFRILARQNIVLKKVRYVLTDYESGMIPVVREFFPFNVFLGPDPASQRIIHLGCSFHQAQAVYRNVKSLGYQTMYQTNPSFRFAIRNFLALGHVPATHKRHYLDVIMAHFCNPANPTPESQHVKRFAEEYFIPTWFGTYELSMWDWFGHSVRTNNDPEAYHSALKNFFQQPHMTIFKFLTFLHKEEKQIRSKLAGRIAGNDLPKGNVVYERLNKRIMNIQSEFSVRLPLDYLAGLANCAPNAPFAPQ